MYCNQCGNYLMDDHQFCMNCGAKRPVLPETKKGTRWIPITITVLLAAIGCAVYYFSIYGSPLG